MEPLEPSEAQSEGDRASHPERHLRRVSAHADQAPPSEYAYDPYAEQDKEPWERRWEENHAYDPEREE